jgi:hypothetical protein
VKRALLLVTIVLFAGCRCRRDEVTADQTKKPRVESEAVKVCLEGVRGLSRYSDRCEHSALWWGTVERAVEQLRPACEQLVVAPGARFERAEVEKCNAALEKAPCFTSLPVECRIGGSLKLGEGCAFGAQCATGLFCKQTEGAFCGKCAAAGREGDSCIDAQCDEGLVCVAGKCGPPLAAGAACGSPYECARPLSCDMGPGSGVCVPPRKEGEKCEPTQCEVTLRCTGGVCKKRGAPKGPGAECDDPLDCLDYACVHGVCGAPLLAGEPCGEESAPCAASLMCVEGKCVLPDARTCK